MLNDSMDVEWLIVADAAEVVGNKLYVLGGGWDMLTVNTGFPVKQRMAIAAAFRIPWNDTNQRHRFKLEITDEDGHRTFGEISGELEAGRPPGIPAGSAQRAQIAVNIDLELPAAGTYEIRGQVEGREPKRVVFRVVPGAMLLVRQPDQAGS